MLIYLSMYLFIQFYFIKRQIIYFLTIQNNSHTSRLIKNAPSDREFDFLFCCNLPAFRRQLSLMQMSECIPRPYTTGPMVSLDLVHMSNGGGARALAGSLDFAGSQKKNQQ